jgi:hypothetical protein
MDFLTRDIQQSKENSLGLGQKFRSIYSYNGPEGKTDELTVVSSDTETKIPAAGLPFIPSSTKPFDVSAKYVEVLPNGAGHMKAADVVSTIEPGEEFVVSSVLEDGAVQFDFVKVTGTKLTHEGMLGLSFEPVQHRGVETDIPFGSLYENGAYTMRPVSIKRYFVDRKTNPDHPSLALSVNDGEPITIARNIVAFQLRYLEVRDGEVEGQWVTDQSLSREMNTIAVEVTVTGRTEIQGDEKVERLVTMASVIRPRRTPGGEAFGSATGTGTPGLPADGGGGTAGGGPGDGGDGGGDPNGGGFGDDGNGNGGGFGSGGSGGSGGSSGLEGEGYNHRTRRIGKQPRLGERLNPGR